MRLAARLARHRAPLVAVALSLVAHAALVTGLPHRLAEWQAREEPAYTATLEMLPEAAPASPAPPPPAPPRKARPKARAPVVAATADAAAPDTGSQATADFPPEALAPMDTVASTPMPELLALAAPPSLATVPEFPARALPADVRIDYQLTSAFADGKATYRWTREADRYDITGEAQAEGFFALFLEGRILQEARGTVTENGLRPEAFSERKPNAAPEGLEFDWDSRTVTFDRNGTRKTGPLQDNTVDWLSMIFQLAHQPPSTGATDLRVYTQRKMYAFRLQVLGEEWIDVPLGRLRALHLRHVDEKDATEVVDVWLGIEQHHVPVKIRFPVARNRFMVEQVATAITAR